MNFIIISLLLPILGFSASGNNNVCVIQPGDIPKDWINMKDSCINAMRDQVSVELEAALVYMSMGAHFSQTIINRPGFSEMFFKSASEEREHAIHIMNYLTMRGILIDNSSLIIKPEKINPVKTVWTDGVEALKDSLVLETSVTEKITNIIKICEKAKDKGETKFFNDYHLVDYLTGVYLEEQLKGQEDIAKKLVTLLKLIDTYKSFGEFLFDKKLLNGEPM